jgi:erythrin-vacuolar iron transport family protein
MTPVPPTWAPDPSTAPERPHRHFRPHSISASWSTQSQTPQAKRAFLLQRAQPALSGLIDGSLSSLAPIFAVALATHTPRYAFFAGLATAVGAGVSMSFSEGLSDTGEDTGRGSPRVRGAITGAGTFIGGFLHTLPFLIPSYSTAVVVAILVVMFELATLAFLRMRFFDTSFTTSLLNVALAGVIIVGASAALGSAAS